MTPAETAYIRAEMERGPLDREMALVALAAWAGRVMASGTNGPQTAQLMMAAACRQIVDSATCADEASAIFNVLSAQAASILCRAAETKFFSAGEA